VEHIKVRILPGGSHADRCCEFCHEDHRQMMGFLVQEEEEDDSSSSSSSSIAFFVKHPMQGLRIPNQLSPRFVVFKVCMHGISHMTRSRWWSGYPHSYYNRKKKLSGSVWRNQESDWGTTWLCCHMTGASAISLTEISLTHSSDLVEARGFMRWQFICTPLSPHPLEQDSIFTFLHWLSVFWTWIHSFSI